MVTSTATQRSVLAGTLNVLPEDDVLRIHDAALAILQDPGIESESQLILDIMARSGARVDRDTRRIHIPPDMVDAALRTAPGSFVLHARRDPARDLLLEPGRVYWGMGGTSEPYFFDYERRQPRSPTHADMVTSTRIGHALPNIDFVQTLCMSGDKPTGQIFFHDFDAIFRNTTKPTVINILDRRFTQLLLGMTAAASGGEAEAGRAPQRAGHRDAGLAAQGRGDERGHRGCGRGGRAHPLLARPHDGCERPGHDRGHAGADRRGGVVRRRADPTAPARRTGRAQAGHGCVRMRTSQCTYGSPEQNLGKAAMAQMARHYGCPSTAWAAAWRARRPMRRPRRSDDEHVAQRACGRQPQPEPRQHGVRAVWLPGDGRHLRRAGPHGQARPARHHGGRRHAGAGRDPAGGAGRQLPGQRPHRPPLPRRTLLPRSCSAARPSSSGPRRARRWATTSHALEEILATAGPVPLPPEVDRNLELALRERAGRDRRHPLNPAHIQERTMNQANLSRFEQALRSRPAGPRCSPALDAHLAHRLCTPHADRPRPFEGGPALGWWQDGGLAVIALRHGGPGATLRRGSPRICRIYRRCAAGLRRAAGGSRAGRGVCGLRAGQGCGRAPVPPCGAAARGAGRAGQR